MSSNISSNRRLRCHRHRFFVAGLILAAVLHSPLFAADGYMAHYRAYMEAHSQNDIAGALVQGEAAWRAAESELGDHATTATLAYNYAKLAALFADSSATGLVAFDRALTLSNGGIAELDTLQLQMGRDELAIQLDREPDLAAASLAQALSDHATTERPASDITAQAWATLADYRLAQKSLREASQAAERAVAHAEVLQPVNTRVLAQALITGAIANSRSRPSMRDPEVLTRAVQDLERAIALFSPQASLDSFDRTLAKALIWRESIVALNQTVRRQADRPGQRGKRKPEEIQTLYLSPLIANYTRPNAEDCPALADYMVTTRLRYPRSAARKGVVGAVLFGFEIDGLRISRAEVLAAPDGTGFGEATEQMLSEWKLKEPYPERCIFPFYMTYAKFTLR